MSLLVVWLLVVALVWLYSRTMARRDSGASSDDGPLTARITNEAANNPDFDVKSVSA